MTEFKALVARHPASMYFALTFVISWSGALLAIGGGGDMLGTTPGSDPRFACALIAMLAGPSTAALLLSALLDGRSGPRKLLARLRTWRAAAGWYAVAILTGPALMMTTLLALTLISPAFLPGIFTSPEKGSLLLTGLAVGLSAGIFEELGWTGFAIPTVRRRHGLAATGLIVGIWWSAWHLLPNVWSSRAAAGELDASAYLVATAAGVFVGYLTAFRILMAWVYDRTKSLPLAMLMHLSFTASLLILNPLAISGAYLVAYSFALAGAVWILVAIVAAVDRGRLRAAPLQKQAA